LNKGIYSMSHTTHHPARIVSNNLGWQKSIKCTIILKSLLLTVVMTSSIALADTAIPARPAALQQASSGTASPCQPPQIQHADKRVVYRSQRPAGNPSLTPAMALSIALGLRTATGPMLHSPGPAKVMKTADKDATTPSGQAGRIALASGRSGACVLSGKTTYQKLAMENY